MVVSPDTAAVPPNSSVGARVRWYVHQRGWSLMTLHNRTVELDRPGPHAGVSHSTLSLLTRGLVHYPQTRTIELIAKALDVPRSSLMPTALDQPTSDPVSDLGDGVVLVPVVRPFAAGGGHLETGETTSVPTSIPGRHGRLLACRVNGGGLPPYVAVGALAIFDPDRDPRDRDPVIIDYQGAVHAAWYLERSARDAVYRLGDGVILGRRDAALAGVFLGAIITPPRYPDP